MKLLGHISDQSLGFTAETALESTFNKREAVRAIIFNKDNKITLLYSTRDGYHKLPGGGIEPGEDWKAAVLREALEEVGFSIVLRSIEIGYITESRAQHSLLQTSYCGVADITGDQVEIQLTPEEVADDLTPKWAELKEAVQLLSNDRPQNYMGHFIRAQDLEFLHEATTLIR